MSKITVMVFEDVEDDLIEHIKALARSATHIEDIEPSPDSVTFGDFEISFGWRKMFCKGQEIPLTRIEFDLLIYFVHNPNRVFTYDQIYERIWKDVPYGEVRKLIFYHIGNLRDKLKGSPLEIISCREVGYALKVHTK